MMTIQHTFNKIFTFTIISILVFLQVKHGINLTNTTPYIDYDTILAASPAILPSSDNDYKKLEMKYQEVLQEMELFRKEVDSLKSGLLRSNRRKKSEDVEFSACLLIKDENHNLPEWLAYHYYMTKLRHLVVCLDPFSESSPQQIFDTWTNETSLKVEIWHERTFFQASALKRLLNISHTEKIIKLHRDRQKACYSKCIRHLRRLGKTWTMFIDVDEYLTFNSVADDDSARFYRKVASKYEFTLPEWHYLKPREIDLIESRTRLPTGLHHYTTNLTISEYIKQEQDSIPWIDTDPSCIVLPRLQFADADETNQSKLEQSMTKQTSKQFQIQKFSTLRFFQHAKKGSKVQNKFGKSIIDVSRTLDYVIRNPHSLIEECGGEESGLPKHEVSLLRVNHYLPPKDFFFSKVDYRRDDKMYEERASVNASRCYEMQGWLDRFIECIGGSMEKAKMLLEGAGEYIEYKGTRDFFAPKEK